MNICSAHQEYDEHCDLCNAQPEGLACGKALTARQLVTLLEKLPPEQLVCYDAATHVQGVLMIQFEDVPFYAPDGETVLGTVEVAMVTG